MIKEILYNPYRVLGVYSNSSKKEQIANKGKIQAFLKVKKSMSFPLDLPQFLPPIERTEELLEEASSKLTLTEDQIKYALFWFINKTPVDEVAFNHLFSGDIKSAREIWGKVTNMSSLQNLFVLELICDNIRSNEMSPLLKNPHKWVQALRKYKEKGLYGFFPDAIKKYALPLYDDYLGELIAEICDNSLLSQNDYMHTIIDVLDENEKPLGSLDDIDDGDWIEYIQTKKTNEIIKKLEDSIKRSTDKNVKEDPELALNFADSLIFNSKHYLNNLKKIIGEDSSQFIIIADKMAMAIIDCMVEYYNNTNDKDAPVKALPLCDFACEIAKGAVAKKRAKRNRETVKHAFDKLPPKEVLEFSKQVEDLLSWYEKQPHTSLNALSLLEKARIPIICIKEKLGSSHNYYLEICSSLGNESLNYIIDEVNTCRENYENPSESSSSGSSFFKNKNIYKVALEDALRTMSVINLLDKTADFSRRFQTNNNIINKLVLDYKRNSLFRQFASIKTYQVNKRFFYSDHEFFNSCYNKEDLEDYLSSFPEGKHVEEVKAKLKEITDRQDDNKFNSCTTKEQYEEYLSLFPNGKHIKEAEERINSLADEEDDYLFNHSYYREDFEEYLRCYPKGKHIEEAKKKIREYIQDEVNIFNSCKFINNYKEYIDSYPNGLFVKEANKRIEKHYDIIRKSLIGFFSILFCIIAFSYFFSACS